MTVGGLSGMTVPHQVQGRSESMTVRPVASGGVTEVRLSAWAVSIFYTVVE